MADSAGERWDFSSSQQNVPNEEEDVAGKVLDRWAIMTFEEEIATLQQFLRFGETKSIVELMALQDKEGQAVLVPSTRTNSDIRTFIERNTPRSTANISTAKVEKISGNSIHHFENFINSMAFMLPFQLLGSVPAPFLGSPPGAMHHQNQQHPQSCGASVEQHTQRKDEARDNLCRDNPLYLSNPSESSLLGSNSVSYTSDLVQGGERTMDTHTTTTKVEAEDFSTSDNYSDGSSTPCTPSITSDVTQMSPEAKMRCLDRNRGSSGGISGGGASMKKGRVFCNACEKTFYDKGTLKIHYNAVHLKIKHKCTIEGCNMVFSSLRSRNRHSANPNPRLHMPMNRNNRDKDSQGNLSADEGSQGEKRAEFSNRISISSSESHKSAPSYMVSHVDTATKLHSSSFSSMGQTGILFPNLKTVQPVLPFYRSLVTPAELANTPGTLPSLPILSSSVPVKPITAPEACITDPIPKKKSRKSSMPIKIEKEMIEQDEHMDEGSCSEEEVSLQCRDKDDCDSNQEEQYMFNKKQEKPTEAVNDNTDKEKERDGSTQRDQTLARNSVEMDNKHDSTGQNETIISVSPSSLEMRLPGSHKNSADKESLRSEERADSEHGDPLHTHDRVAEEQWDEERHQITNGGSLLLDEKGDLDRCSEDHGVSGLSHLDPDANLQHHCEICSKTFKNPYSVKIHYQNIHLKEMHMCVVEGCNAAFPSRRSRDRHSANLNLHHKLLTKDSLRPATPPCSPSSHCREPEGLEPCHNQQDKDLLHQDPISQTSVIFRGHSRMGLVFPMSKAPAALSSIETLSTAEMEGLGGDYRGGDGNEGAVLDLSTSALPQSSWDSDGAESDEREAGEEDDEVLPTEESDESCDGTGSGRPKTEELAPGGHRNQACSRSAQNRLQGAGSPITCHICRKVYSNKGTFRAHYKTVHLRLLHKCKVPGCETSFSSVRSRNRHSQNPNLHKNLCVGSGTASPHE